MQLGKYLSAAAVLWACWGEAQAQSQIAVVVSPSTNVSSITREQVTSIFLGRTQNLPGGAGRALPVDQTNEALREQFSNKVVGKTSAQMKAVWSRLIFSGAAAPPKEVSDSAAVKAYLASHPGAIGYIEAAAVDASVKVVLTVD